MLVLTIIAALALTLAGTAGTRPHPYRRCDPAYAFVTRDSATTYVLARATRDTVVVSEPPEIRKRAGTVFAQHAVGGQLVELQRVEGPGAELVRRTVAVRRDPEVVMVPWQYGADCRPWYWGGTARWITPGTSGVLMVSLRPESLWTAGRPTFDSWMAVIRTYADGPAIRGPSTRPNPEAPPNMSAAEFFELLMALPTDADSNNPVARTRLRDWMRAHPTAQNRYPASSLWVWWSAHLSRAP